MYKPLSSGSSCWQADGQTADMNFAMTSCELLPNTSFYAAGQSPSVSTSLLPCKHLKIKYDFIVPLHSMTHTINSKYIFKLNLGKWTLQAVSNMSIVKNSMRNKYVSKTGTIKYPEPTCLTEVGLKILFIHNLLQFIYY